MFWWLAPQTFLPPVVLEGLKPPWNQPQVMPLAFKRSPTLVPLMLIRLEKLLAQSSRSGRGSPITVPLATLLATSDGVAPWVWPAIRLSAPTLEGPKVVLKELSLIAKRWA